MGNCLVVIEGPTASGKTDLAFQLAQEWSCPILSADSRQVYKLVNTGTAKPSVSMLQTVKHYFIDHVNIDEDYNVGTYETEANDLIENLFQSHDKLILCGGSGLYIKSVIHGLDELPASTPQIRRQVDTLYKDKGLEGLQQFIRETDPGYYHSADIQNPRRLQRAIEVYLLTGKPYTSFRKGQFGKKNFRVIELCLLPDREKLYSAIHQRVDEMIKNGLVEETNALWQYRNTQAMDTVGYKEIIAYLEGKLDLPSAIELIKKNSRNYAKRQCTWFKKANKGLFFDPDDRSGIGGYLQQELFPG